MSASQLYTTAWSYDAASQNGFQYTVVPLPSSIPGVEAGPSSATADRVPIASTSGSASHVKLYELGDKRSVVLRVLEPGNALQVQDARTRSNTTFVLPGTRQARIVPECLATQESIGDESVLQISLVADLGVGLVAYRLSLSEEALENAGELPLDTRGSRQWCAEQQILPAQLVSKSPPVLVHAVQGQKHERDALVVALSDGALLKLEWLADEGRFQETPLVRQQSILSSMRSFLPGRFGSSSNLSAMAASPARTSTVQTSAEQVVSMVALAPDYFCAVTRNRKMRIWHVPSNTCVASVELPSNPMTMEIVPSVSSPEPVESSDTVPLLSAAPTSLLRSFPSDLQSHKSQYILAYVPTHNIQTSFFVLYLAKFDDSRNTVRISAVYEKACDFAVESSAATSYLSDFYVGELERDNDDARPLWTLWNESGQSILRRSALNFDSASQQAMIADPNDTIVSVNALVGHGWQLVETSPHQANHSIDIPAAAFDRAYAALRAEVDSSTISMAQLAHEVALCAKSACIDSFLSHLFHPGRYPSHSLNNALLSYIHSLTRAEKSQTSHIRIPTREDASIAQQMLDVVGSQLQAQEDATTGALREEDFVKAYKLEFMKVLALAEESKRNAKVPLSLSFPSDSSTLLVFAKAAVAAPVPPTVPRSLPDSGDVAPGAVGLQQSHDVQERAVSATYTLAQSLLARLRSIDGLSVAAFENNAVQAVSAPSSKAIEDVAVDLFQDTIDALIDDDVQSAFSQQLCEIAAIANQSFKAAGGSAALVDTLGLALQDLTEVTQHEAARSRQGLSDRDRLFDDIIVQDAASLLTARYEHAMAIFLVIVLIHNGLYEPDGNDDEEQADEQDGIGAEDSIELLSRAWTTLAGFAIAKWICHHNIAMTNLQCELSETQDETTHGLLQRLQEMRMQSMNGKASGDIHERNFPVSLLASLYTATLRQMETEGPPEPTIRGWTAKLLMDVGFLQHQAFSASKLAAIAAVFIEKGWDAETLQLLGLCPEKDEDAALLHLQAVIACRSGDLTAALRHFNKVAAAIYAEDASLINLGEAIDAEDCGSRSAYYRLAVSLLEVHQPNLEVAVASIKVIDSFDEENPDAIAEEERPSWLRDYWTKAFRNYTAIGMYEEAFTIMMSIPQRSQKLDALRHLTAVMCESGATALLLKLSLVDMQEDMQTCLSFRARNAHPLAEPDYHTTLHAFQCMMNDYRGAAATMYQKARRLAALPVERDLFIQVLTTQCQSYLSAITVLELLESGEQSIQVTVEGAPASPKKRKRQRLLDPKMQDASVITLEAIRREYVLTLARLQLSQSFPDLVGTGKHLDARAAVALFTQIGAFDSALRTALALGLDMSNIFEHLTLRCISYSQQGPDQGGEASWVLQDSLAADWEGSLASRAWKLLQVYLERYDMDGQYRRTVLSVILVEDRRIRLPKSLVDWFMAEQPDHLIWKLVQYDLLEDAFVYTFRMLDQASTQLQNNVNSRRSAAIYIPYNLLDQLLQVNMEGESVRRQQAVEEQQKKLRQEVNLQWRRMDQVLTVL